MKYRFEEIAVNSTSKKIPVDSDKEHYIGLEHLDSCSLTVTRWGAEVAPTGEKLLMKKGDVLFGKRRAYQRKVGIAPFDGIFSAHGMVLRPNENIVTKDFFPFFISSDQFMERAVRISVGGLSPTINWKDLKTQEFDLPPIEEQRVLADKLWAAYRLKESYRRLLTATQEMVKSQFIEMFGKVYNGKTPYNKVFRDETKKATKIPASEYAEQGDFPIYDQSTDTIIAGYTSIKDNVCYNFPVILFGDHSRVIKYIEEPYYIGADGVKIIKCASDDILPKFAYYLLRYEKIPNTGYNRHYKWLKEKSYSIPPLSLQKQFVAIAEQADKSEFDEFKSQFIEMFGDPMINDRQWKIFRQIKESTQIVLGSTPNSKNPEYWDGECLWITPAEMTDNSFYIYDTQRHITEKGKEAANLTLMPEGTVLFSTRAPIGKVGIVGKPMCCNQGFKNFICNVELNPIFLYYTLIFKRDYLCSLGTGTTFKELSKKVVESLMVAVPPKSVQDKLAEIYHQADKSEYYYLN